MACSISEDSLREFERRFSLHYKRDQSFQSMKDGLIKDWIVELSAENIELSLRLAEAHKQLGSSAFNPVHI